MTATDDPAVGVCFVVKIDDFDLGSFSTCEGLGCEIVVEQREEGGNNSFVWQLPTRIKYPNVKLSRPLTPDTQKVGDWFAKLVDGFKRATATITAMTSDGTQVATWSLHGVVPVRWTGPSFSSEAAKVLTETVEIAHHGFLSS
jgi:phage tail-like protein